MVERCVCVIFRNVNVNNIKHEARQPQEAKEGRRRRKKNKQNSQNQNNNNNKVIAKAYQSIRVTSIEREVEQKRERERQGE